MFIANADENGKVIHDGFGYPNTENLTLIRRSADVLYFMYKHFELMKEVPEKKFIQSAKACADAFVKKTFKTYGQMGQFLNVETGEIVIGGSVAGALCPAALIRSYRYFGNEVYLETAKAIGDYYYDNFLSKGYTTGGPAEILQCPDSESAAALLESYVELYDETREVKWLEYAKTCAHLCSSWTVAYNYKFPVGSEFNKLDMKTIGSVFFANVQNKHSAPGICTLSGLGLLRLYEFTGEDAFYTLYKEITSTISQYMSTNERPIYSWDVPKDAASLVP